MAAAAPILTRSARRRPEARAARAQTHNSLIMTLINTSASVSDDVECCPVSAIASRHLTLPEPDPRQRDRRQVGTLPA